MRLQGYDDSHSYLFTFLYSDSMAEYFAHFLSIVSLLLPYGLSCDAPFRVFLVIHSSAAFLHPLIFGG
jgi:hypothetical protein